MSRDLFIVVAGLGAGAALAWFVHLERMGKRIVAVLVILGLLVVESVIYPNPNLVPPGIFHPGVGGSFSATGADYNLGTSFRLPDILIPLALLARVLGRGRPLRLNAAGVWWLAFSAWLAAAAVVGKESGNSSSLIFYEGKAIIYIGFLHLVAGVPVSEYVHGRAFRRFLMASAALAAFAVVLEQSGRQITASLPLLPIRGMGPMGADTATIFLTLGMITAALCICSERSRLSLLVASVPLLLASFVAGQRAALIAFGLALLAMIVLVLTRWRRIRVTPTELGLGAATLAMLLMVPVLVTAVAGKSQPAVPLLSSVTADFTTQAKQLSAQDRLNQWTSARSRIDQHPWMGSGLGTEYTHYDPGFKVFVSTDLTHNIVLDLLMRTGAIGLGLFLVAVALTLSGGIRTWWQHEDALIAAFALAVSCALIGLLGKGMVESIFEKFRLATLLGFLIGAVASSTLSAMETREARAADERLPLATGRTAWN
ncbi:MAG: O-antigen ligase family protein [Gaiellaceae bacterium]